MQHCLAVFASLLCLVTGEAGAQEPSAETISRIMGVAATTTADGVVRVGWPRTAVAFHVDGLAFRPAMGLKTWAAFQATPHGTRLMGDTVVFEDEVNAALDALAAVAGDIAMTAREVQPVLKALRGGGIHIVALHNHMLGESPAIFFTHFWGKGAALKLARGLRGALDAQRGAAKGDPSAAYELALDFDRMEATLSRWGSRKRERVALAPGCGSSRKTTGRQAAADPGRPSQRASAPIRVSSRLN